ncbi:ubiquitin-like Rad60 SUMO-like protein [Medicago truncatula]|uniref:Ubiquitin-like Rad60 SUMO-like protein n=2 Tax=Medicago truncatula TaxID=3880 RepID=G7KYE5_MEDTR|nr:ubiquitin-like Rad60 SUMO-like protein [Medicago truncatula]
MWFYSWIVMQIFIETQGGERFPLMVKSSDRIFNVMEKILEKEDIPVHNQCLIFDYRRLDYNLTCLCSTKLGTR